MYVDSSRIKDLIQLKAWMEDPKFSKARREMFHQTYKKIQSQLHDRKLAQMRERLVRATIAENKLEMWKITNQIKDYSKEELIGQQYE
jgi:hypothetical protein